MLGPKLWGPLPTWPRVGPFANLHGDTRMPGREGRRMKNLQRTVLLLPKSSCVKSHTCSRKNRDTHKILFRVRITTKPSISPLRGIWDGSVKTAWWGTPWHPFPGEDADLWTTRSTPFLGAFSRHQCPQGWGTCLGVFSTVPHGDGCERHGPSLPLTGW